MLKNMRVYKIGDTYKYVSVNLIENNKNNDFVYKRTENEKYFNNIVRAKSEIKDLILCNDFKYFVTLTFNSNFDRFNLKELRTKINNKIRKLRKKHNLPFKFLLVPEKHKNGAYHLHGCFDGSVEKFLYINENGFYNCSIFDYFGFNSFSFIKNKDKVSSYMTKYITKDFKNREMGEHLYFASQGLKKPILIENLLYNTKDLKRDFFNYSNDFCSIRYDNKKIFLKSIAL